MGAGDNQRNGVPGRRQQDRWAVWDKRVRDIVLFTLGAAGIVNEFFLADTPDLSVLGIALTLVGLPLAFLADARRRDRNDD